MPAKMTPAIHLLLASFGNPKLKLTHPAKMASNERKRAEIHSRAAAKEMNSRKRLWRFQLRNNAAKRAQNYLEDYAAEALNDALGG
jgi:hypothetical protein